MDPKYFWLVMSVEKNDARIIDSESDAWGYLSQCDKFKRTTGAETRLFFNNDWHLYKVIRHGTDNYEKDLLELRKQLKLDEPEAFIDDSEEIGEERSDVTVKLPSKLPKGEVVLVRLFYSKIFLSVLTNLTYICSLNYFDSSFFFC